MTATLGKEGRALKTENADLVGMVMKFTFVLSGQKIWGDALLKERGRLLQSLLGFFLKSHMN